MSRPARTVSALRRTGAAVVLAIILSSCPAQGTGLIRGEAQPCLNEGEEVELEASLDGPCTTCRCTRGTVICNHERCPMAETCHLVLLGQRLRPGSCCERCKGCATSEGAFEEGEEWRSPDQPCTVSRCRSGVITHAKVKCHVPCSQPLPPLPGHCCPRCPSCQLAGHVIAAGHNLTLPKEPCRRCACHADGTQSCTTEVCPALSCPSSEMVHPFGHCCPRCAGKPRRLPPQFQACQLGRRVYSPGENFTLDACTDCTCRPGGVGAGTAVCLRRSCPPLDCPRRLQVFPTGQCCPLCRPPERVRRVCQRFGRRYKDGETWELNDCTNCSCIDGEISCVAERCPAADPSCPLGHRPAKVSGHCCKQCVEDDAVCTVFGDPHYSSFDGRIFNFQGSCKYLLAKDCVGKNFSVRVNNHPRKSRLFSWTRSATIRVGDMRIALRQKKQVRVNQQVVKLPYLRLGQVNIRQDPDDNFNVLVKLTAVGDVSILWDGDSFLQVKVPPAYKNHMCGLCGNYNGNKTDDFLTKRGRLAPLTKRFARSWRVGGRSHCSAPPRRKPRRRQRKKRPRPPCGGDRSVRVNAVRQCNRLKAGAFTSCHALVHPAVYFKSCVQDMCECGRQKLCYCEALTAYAHACQRRGATVDWLAGTDCAARNNCVDGDDCPTR